MAKRIPKSKSASCIAFWRIPTHKAGRLPPESLGLILNDAEPEIRRIVAERIQPEALHALVQDPDWGVRLQVAERATRRILEVLIYDTDPDVKEVARQRLREMDTND